MDHDQKVDVTALRLRRIRGAWLAATAGQAILPLVLLWFY